MGRLRVGIIFGGKSAEHEVSLQSARNVYDAIDRSRYEPVLIGIDKAGRWALREAASFLLHADDPSLIALNRSGEALTFAPEGGGRLFPAAARDMGTGAHVAESESALLSGEGPIDVAFPILHGPLGEDGTVQGFLKLAGIPFVGSGVLGSALGMDKDMMKRLLRDAGLPIARFEAFRSGRPLPPYRELVERLGSPLFVKPANMGSSVGVSKVRDENEYRAALALAFRYDTKALVEEFVAGRELECSVLGNEEPEASVLGEIVTAHDFYSYEAKYIDEKGAILRIPAELDEATSLRARSLAIDTFVALACEGLGRVDMFLRSDGSLVVNEINTMPGFTAISMYPKLWEASGLSYADLIDRLIRLALERAAREKDLSTSH